MQAPEDKAERTRLHAEVARCFPGLETDTMVEQDRKLVRARITTNRGGSFNVPDYNVMKGLQHAALDITLWLL